MLHRPVIDGFEFAAAGSRLSGEWPVSDFPRLRDVLHSGRGTLRYELQGVPELQGRPGLRLQVTGTLDLTCQRCLEALEQPLQIDALLLLYAGERDFAAIPVEADGPDRIVGAKDMAVHDLIEEEVLLAIPYAPRHEYCEAGRREEIAARQKPFAGLRSLLDAKH